MSDDCKGIFGKIFGHNYQARYTTGPGDFSGMEGSLHACLTMMEEAKSKTYECDICSRCGKVVKND